MNAPSLYRRAGAGAGAFVVAAVATALFATNVLHPAGVVVHGSSPSVREQLVETPADWASMPPVATWQSDKVTATPSFTFELMTSATILQAAIGDVFVRYRVTACSVGGSACAGSSQTLDDISFGSLDANGQPNFSTDFRCVSSSPFAYLEPPVNEHRSCAPETFVVRSDGARFVLTIRDPEPIERPLATILRSRSRVLPPWSTPAWSIDRVLLVAFAGALLLAGASALARARRFRQLQSWIPTLVYGEEVLVDPRAPKVGTAYRDSAPLAPAHIHHGSLASAASTSDFSTGVAVLSLIASALVSFVGFLAY